MFVGREIELAELAALWRKPVASLVTCRGRRRIGKSTLIQEFARISQARFVKIEGKPPEGKMSNRSQLDSFGEQLSAVTGRRADRFENWNQAFAALDKCIGGQRTVLLLDEISWMGRYATGFAGDLKIAWDNLFKRHPRLIVFLCGSVSTWISTNILNNTGFVGRASLNMVVRELELADCVKFWGRKAARTSTRDIVDVLSVTGGVPRYLEEIDPALSADENIRRLCFRPDALLRDDFSKIFNVVFGESAVTKRRILELLSVAPQTVSQLAESLEVERSGSLSDHLNDLIVAGFVSEDVGLNPATGKVVKSSRYRVADNYTRFYLKHIGPNGRMIDAGSFGFRGLELLKGWDVIMGLQFETLVLSHLQALLPKLGFGDLQIKSAAPYRQTATQRKRGCQIDLLIQTDRRVCIVEIKRKREIGCEIIDEVESKVRALDLPRDKTVRTALVYEGKLMPSVRAEEYFDAIVAFDDLLGLQSGCV